MNGILRNAIRAIPASLVVMASLTACNEDSVPANLEVTAPEYLMSAAVGAQDTLEVTIRNARHKSVGLSLPALPGDLAYDASAGTCGATLAASASCHVVLVFTPTSAYLHEYTMRVDDEENDYHDPELTLTLDSRAVASGSLEVSAARSQLSAEVGGHDTLEVTVHNARQTTVGFSLPALPADLAYDAAAGTCGATLAAGASCLVTLVFTPTTGYQHDFSWEVDDATDDNHDPALALTLDSADVGWAGVRYVHDEGPAEASAVARDAAGNVYLAGLTRQIDGVTAVQGFFVTRYSRKGVREWTTYTRSTAGHLLWGPRSMVASNSQVCFTYSTWLNATPTVQAYTTLQCVDARVGTGLWSQALSAGDGYTLHRDELAMAGNGDLLVSDLQGPYSAPQPHVYRYSSTGTQLWHRVYDGTITVHGLAVATTGFVLSAGVQGNAFGLSLSAAVTSGVVARFDDGGDLLWATEVGRVTVDDNVAAVGAAVDANNIVYASTWRTENNVVNPDLEAVDQVRLVSLNANGTSRWSRTLPLSGTGGYAYDVAVSDDGQQVLVGGSVLANTGTLDVLPAAQGNSQSGGLLALYDAAGDLQWLKLQWTQADGWVSNDDVAFAPGGDVLSAGLTKRYHLDGTTLPAGIVPATSGETPRAGFLARFHPDGTAD